MSDNISVGFDMGMGALKLWGSGGGIRFISQVATNGADHVSGGVLGLRNRKRPSLVHGSFGSFYAGEYSHEFGPAVENLDFDRLTGSPEMKALFYAALASYQEQCGRFSSPVSVVAGLPLQMMVGEAAEDNKRGVKGWLKGVHEFSVDGKDYRVEIEDVKTTSQPVGALFDHAYDDQGRPYPERGYSFLEEIGVISIGFNTVEMLVVNERRSMDALTKGNTLGVRRLLELINREELYSLGEMDARLRAGKLQAELKTALPIWEREVTGQIERVWRRVHRRFAKVLVVGGGAILLRDAMAKAFQNKAWIPDDPVQSISRGLWKLAVRKK